MGPLVVNMGKLERKFAVVPENMQTLPLSLTN